MRKKDKSFYLPMRLVGFSLQTWNVGVWLGLFVIIGCCAVSASAQTRDARLAATERDELWVRNYRNLDVGISLEDAVSKLGIIEDTVRTKVELRLRQANIRPVDSAFDPSNDGQTLLVSVSAVGQAFDIEINFMRRVLWYLPDGKSTVHLETVWNTGRVGTHGSNSDFILSSLDKALDSFLNAYLKANQ